MNGVDHLKCLEAYDFDLNFFEFLFNIKLKLSTGRTCGLQSRTLTPILYQLFSTDFPFFEVRFSGKRTSTGKNLEILQGRTFGTRQIIGVCDREIAYDGII